MKKISELLFDRGVIVSCFCLILIADVFVAKPIIFLVIGIFFGVAVLVNARNVSRSASAVVNASDTVNASLNAVLEKFTLNSAELAAAAEEISSTAIGLAERSAKERVEVTGMLTSVEGVAMCSGEGNGAILNVVEDMQKISATMESAVETMKEIEKNSNHINATINVICDIADQTNLLALNAAIEAARAGEHGKGFAVVAAEVRKLAEKSAVSAKEIIKAVKISSAIVAQGTSQVEGAGADISKSVTNINFVAKKFNEIGTAIVDQLGIASSLDEMTAANAKAAEEIGAASEELATTASEQGKALAYQKNGAAVA